MEIMNCQKCGKVFTRTNEAFICSECNKEEEAIYLRVKEYLDSHPECRMDELVRETEASTKRIMRYLREGRIQLAHSSTELRCQSCGRPIRSGKFCDPCVISINHEVQDLFTEKKPKMHTMDRFEK